MENPPPKITGLHLATTIASTLFLLAVVVDLDAFISSTGSLGRLGAGVLAASTAASIASWILPMRAEVR